MLGLKLAVEKLKEPGFKESGESRSELDKKGQLTRMGAFTAGFSPVTDDIQNVFRAVITFWTCAPRSPISGVTIWQVGPTQTVDTVEADERNWLVCWQAQGAATQGRFSTTIESIGPEEGVIEILKRANVNICSGGFLVVLPCCPAKGKHLLEHREDLEVIGIPILNSHCTRASKTVSRPWALREVVSSRCTRQGQTPELGRAYCCTRLVH